MHDVSCVLLSKSYKTDENGNILKDKNGREVSEIKESEIPIISVEKVWKDEFYKANQLGLRPSIRIKISSLNYNGEEEIIYMNKHYTVIRTDGDNNDEVVLICQKRANNVK
jgi:SPP1 family predicted phage head-tail adaptor